MTDEIKTALAMALGAISSLLGHAIGFTTKISMSLNMAFFSTEFLETAISSLIIGGCGALGGLVVREAYKLIVFGFKYIRHRTTSRP